MEVQGEQGERIDPFEIVHNARSSRASRSRKSSISVLDRERPRPKAKKLRKMTLNPESIRYQEIKEIEEHHMERMGVHSERAEEGSMEELSDFGLPFLGWPCKMQSEKEQQLENAIVDGLGNERDLDWECSMGGKRRFEEFQMREECCE